MISLGRIALLTFVATCLVAPAFGQYGADEYERSRTTSSSAGRTSSGRYGATIRRSGEDRRIGRSLTPFRERQLDLSTDTLPPPRASTPTSRSPASSSSSARSQIESEPRLLPGPSDPFDPDFGATAPKAVNDPLPFATDEFDLSLPDNIDLRPGGDFYINTPPEPLARQALKMFVRNTFRTTYIPAPSGSDRIEMLDIEGNMSVAMPWSKPENAVVLTPGFGIHSWQGPEALPVPGTLYDNYIDILWRLILQDRWTFDVAVTPGVYTDYDSSTNAFRLMARGSASFQWTPQFQVTAGAIYLNLSSVKLLPFVGAVWEPREDLRFELLAPQPKVFYRVVQYGEQSGWAYLSGEFSGGQWGITEPDGTHNRLSYTDYRLLGGFEWRVTNRVRAYFEGGYAFGRKARLVDSNQELDIEDAFVFRAGTFF